MSVDLKKMADDFYRKDTLDGCQTIYAPQLHKFARQVASAALDGFHAYATEHLEYSYGQCLERYKREICGYGNVTFVTSEV